MLVGKWQMFPFSEGSSEEAHYENPGIQAQIFMPSPWTIHFPVLRAAVLALTAVWPTQPSHREVSWGGSVYAERGSP